MTNELWFFITVVVYLGSVLCLYKLLGKLGMYMFSIFGTLFGNVAACKCINIFGFPTNAGVVIYAATFLVTDILSEKYGKKEAQKAVFSSLAAMLLWVIGTQFTLWAAPNASDFVSSSMKNLFGFAPRIFVASMTAYLCSQTFDVFIYHFIWKKTGNNKTMLWLRNNGGTLLSQALDTVIFITLGFWGSFPFKVFLSVVLTTYLFKALVAVLDTPFIYVARKIKPLIEKQEGPESYAGAKVAA